MSGIKTDFVVPDIPPFDKDLSDELFRLTKEQEAHLSIVDDKLIIAPSTPSRMPSKYYELYKEALLHAPQDEDDRN